MKISACLIVKNEERVLEQCLSSIKDFDEIVILDTGSNDKTGDIAKKYTDKYYANEYTWNDNFAEARNYALAKCTGDWVLSIDADEYLEDGGLEKIKKGIEFAESKGQKTVNCLMIATTTGEQFTFPRLFKKCPEVFWKGAVHNHISISENNTSNITIYYGYSPTHAEDPDRAFRILQKEVKRDPTLRREVFYLAREYWYRKDYIPALYWYKDYLTKGTWAPEIAEANLMAAKCSWLLGKPEDAREYCLEAIKVNADFKEALILMADLSGPKNKEKWLLFAETANNNDVLFARGKSEQGPVYYDNLYTDSKDMQRYYNIYQKVADLSEGKVLDIGCGIGNLSKFVKDYHGFDFSKKAVEEAGDPNIVVGNAYDKENYNGYDTYVSIEVLEHLDDYRILDNIPSGKKVLLSVPSFDDASHLRRYNKEIIHYRYDKYIDIQKIIRFNWDKKWVINDTNTGNYILLIVGTKR